MNIKERIFYLLIAITVIILYCSAFVRTESRYKITDYDYNYYVKIFKEAFQKLQKNYVDGDKLKSKKLFYGAIKGVMNSLGDKYSSFFTPEELKSFEESLTGDFGGLGIQITLRNDRIFVVSPLDNTPAMKAGIRSGDYIWEIEGQSTKGMKIEKAISLMRGKPGTSIKITIFRETDNKKFPVSITRAKIHIESVKFAIIDKNIGYIRISSFNTRCSLEFYNALLELMVKGAEKYIIDLRNNPGGSLEEVIKISDFFLNEGKIVQTKGRTNNDRRVMSSNKYTTIIKKEPVYVLINKFSASASEIFSGAIKDNKRGVIIGEKSFGKGSVQQIIRLNDDILSFLTRKPVPALKLTIEKYYTPNGTDINGVGIKPDIEIKDKELNDDQVFWALKLNKEQIIKDFLKKHKTYNEDNVKEFTKELQKKGYNIPLWYMKRRIYLEKTLYDKNPIFDLTIDDVLKKTLAIINKKSK